MVDGTSTCVSFRRVRLSGTVAFVVLVVTTLWMTKTLRKSMKVLSRRRYVVLRVALDPRVSLPNEGRVEGREIREMEADGGSAASR
jgi:hypothetical protein